MKRKNFIKTATASSIGAFTLPWALGSPKRNNRDKVKSRMKVGCQHFSTSKKDLEYFARHGVFNIDAGAPKFIEGEGWDLSDARAQKEACANYGISIDAYHLPLSSAGIGNVSLPNIMLGKSPERDKEIDMVKQMIEVAGKVGVPNLLYNTTILPVVRNRNAKTKDPKRGNALYSTWNYEKAIKEGQDKEKTMAGVVDIDDMYERITYLLDRILPIAEEYGVRLGNHFADPPLPVGYRGITRWNSPDIFAGIKRYSKLYDSDSHGFNLALGVTAEGLTGSNAEKTRKVCDIIQWVGERNQIFNVHMRNIKGGYNNFMEVYPDNGDIDFVQVVHALRDVGYDGMVMPDHIPNHPDPASDRQGHAFAFGYNKALIQAAYVEA